VRQRLAADLIPQRRTRERDKVRDIRNEGRCDRWTRAQPTCSSFRSDRGCCPFPSSGDSCDGLGGLVVTEWSDGSRHPSPSPECCSWFPPTTWGRRNGEGKTMGSSLAWPTGSGAVGVGVEGAVLVLISTVISKEVMEVARARLVWVANVALDHPTGRGRLLQLLRSRCGRPHSRATTASMSGRGISSPLNSSCGQVACAAGSPQETWLRADLAAHPNECTLPTGITRYGLPEIRRDCGVG
jgi:hypothetical protein